MKDANLAMSLVFIPEGLDSSCGVKAIVTHIETGIVWFQSNKWPLGLGDKAEKEAEEWERDSIEQWERMYD